MSWVIDVRPNAAGWEAQLLDLKSRTVAIDPGTGEPFLPTLRQLNAVDTPAGRFPLPPQTERPAPIDELTRMTSGSDAALIAEYFRKTVTQSISQDGMKVFGSYLFHTLLGEPLWDRMRAVAGNEELELVLSWAPVLQELTRLPWEMMHGTKDFLVVEARVSLAREVAGAKGVLRSINSPPRVLFVIGSTGGDCNFDGLKPGAEYFSLLRGLRQNGLGLNIFPLVGATADKLEVAMKRFRPDVVHFICHGNDDGSIDLVDEKKGYARIKTSADVIYRLLNSNDAHPEYCGPQVVVLSSCYSAGSGGIKLDNAGQVNFPMAVSLVAKGVPVVLGMAGEVANQACRLFGRAFYESLLTDGRLPRAAAKGRRAGLLSPEGLKQRRIDWSLPTLFVCPAAAGAQLPVVSDPAENAWQALAEVFAPEPFPAYYARLDLLRMSGLLMLDEAEQKKVDPAVTMDRQFLGISTPQTSGGRLGRSWALRDLASIAARNGHVPIVLEKRLLGNWPPLTPQDLAKDFLMKAARITLKGFGRHVQPPVEFGWPNSRQVLELAPGARPTPEMPEEISNLYISGDKNEQLEMLSTAIRIDLLDYLERVRTTLHRPDAKLLLIFDDVHRMGDATPFLFKRLFGPDGLRSEREKVRVLFAFSRQAERDDQTPAIEVVTEFLQSNFADEYMMGEFRSPTETRLAYENFLFNWRTEGKSMAYVPATEFAPQVVWLFQRLQVEIGGIPEKLSSSETRAFLDHVATYPPPNPLRIASDEEALQKIL